MNLYYLLALLLTFGGLWKTFEKMDREGWEGIIPIYNIYVITKTLNLPIWWLIIAIIPVLTPFVLFFLYIKLLERFNQNALFAIGMLLLPPIFWAILGFGDAEYNSDAVKSSNDLDDF